jgi:hypothetical protein
MRVGHRTKLRPKTYEHRAGLEGGLRRFPRAAAGHCLNPLGWFGLLAGLYAGSMLKPVKKTLTDAGSGR